jgi:formate hydrogenlyase subunit 4
VIVALFAIARFFTALAGMDIGTAFGGMGSSREMMIASLAEPAMLMAIFTVSLSNRTTSLAQIVQVIYSGQSVIRPSLAFAFLAFILIVMTETGRIPVDNPATHLELTMIHEAMILEYSGRHLALIEWAGMMKLFLFVSLGIASFFPWGIAARGSISGLAPALIYMTLKFGATGVVIVLIETGLAKMRLFRLTEFLGAAFLLATLGMISFFILD